MATFCMSIASALGLHGAFIGPGSLQWPLNRHTLLICLEFFGTLDLRNHPSLDVKVKAHRGAIDQTDASNPTLP